MKVATSSHERQSTLGKQVRLTGLLPHLVACDHSVDTVISFVMSVLNLLVDHGTSLPYFSFSFFIFRHTFRLKPSALLCSLERLLQVVSTKRASTTANATLLQIKE